jgi:tetraacyldisaccharide 4'-kinase
MVRSSNDLSAALFLSREFPKGKANFPALLTVPAAWLYGLASGWYHSRFDGNSGFRAGVPVISVGNLSVGGTGKTPIVIALAQWMMERYPELAEPNAIAVLSRGYGRVSKELVTVEVEDSYQRTGDEPLLIKRALPNLAVVVHARRDWCARFAVERLSSKILILDDGFQHRKLARDLDLVVMDGEAPLGNGYQLPAGSLREKPNGLARASAFVTIGKTNVQAAKLAGLFQKPLIQAIPEMVLPEELSTKLSTPIYVLTSIGRPKRFLKGLRDMGLLIAGGQAFRDHHRFTSKELSAVASFAGKSGAKVVVTTAKDRVRVGSWPYDLPLYVVDLKMRFTNLPAVENLLEIVVRRAVEGRSL